MASDIIIIGGGSAGLGAARAARGVGARPTLVTDGPIGGDCTFTGCVPSKTLIAASREGMPFADAMERVHRTIDRIASTEDAGVLRNEGIDVVEGRGVFLDARTVEVGGTRLTSDHIVIATGSKPSIPPIEGIDSVRFLTNETLFELDQMPNRLGVVGGGAIGCEMAMAFAGFGCAVTLIEGENRLLPIEEPEASAVILDAMTSAGVEVLTGDVVASVRQVDRTIEIDVGSRPAIVVDALLVATGREPNSHGFGVDTVGVELDERGNIVVDEKLRTSVDGVSAAGDVTGLLPFTHSAYEQARMAVGHALGKGARWKYDASSTPWVTFTDPEVARVGMTEAAASDHGGRVAHLPLTHVDRAITEERTEGFVKLIAGPKTLTRNLFGGQVIGATIVAPRAGEMIHGPTLAHRLGMFTGRLAQVTTPYPTWTTAVQQAAGQFFQEVDGLEARPASKTSG